MSKNNKIIYKPSQKVLERYANVLINFALGGGKGIKKGEVVRLNVQEPAKPLLIELRKAVWKAGGHVMTNFIPTNDKDNKFEHHFYQLAHDHQINFFPAKHLKSLADHIDHNVSIMADSDKKSLSLADPKKMMQVGEVNKPFRKWLNDKENKGKFTWTIGLYGTEAMAKEAGLSLKEYWNEIIKACYLNYPNPVQKWKKTYKDLENYRNRLNKMPIEKLHIESKDADLWITLGEKRQWAGGSGRNIPSFELFTSPDWRGTEGWIRFNQPLYRYGNLIEGIELEFKNGKVIRSKAKKNEKLLKQMIATKNADKIGEFSMTDKRFSKITKFMAETLFDENIGGKNGNTHIALGKSYHDCFVGDPSKQKPKDWEKLGFNDSSVHTDIISTAPRTISAYLKDGSKIIIYENGMYNF